MMSRVLCLAQAHGAAKSSRAKTARGAKDASKLQTFTIIERVPLRLAAHKPVWDVLRKHATRQQIVDSEHGEDAFPAGVVLVDQLGVSALGELSNVLSERRTLVLAAEKQGIDCDMLAKPLDRIFEQELEWLQIRNLLAMALRTSGKSARIKKTRALLLIGA